MAKPTKTDSAFDLADYSLIEVIIMTGLAFIAANRHEAEFDIPSAIFKSLLKKGYIKEHDDGMVVITLLGHRELKVFVKWMSKQTRPTQ